MLDRKTQKRFFDRIKTSAGCWEWTGQIHPEGYGHIWVNGSNRFAHRISYELYVGVIPSGLCVCHSCDNRKCVRPSHLWLGTKADNNLDCKTKGRNTHLSGEKSGAAKLTLKDVFKIRKKVIAGKPQRKIASEFGVTQSAISLIVRKINWASS